MSDGKTDDRDGQEPVTVAGQTDHAQAQPGLTTTTKDCDTLKADNAELKDRLLRALAECENVRRRGERAASDARRSAIADFAREMLLVADNLHRAIEAARSQDSVPEAALVDGVRATEHTLMKALEKFGVQRIRALGTAFDPALHEAVQQSPDDEHPPGTVIEVLEDGYMLDDRLLRPARAVVAGKPEQRSAQGAQG